MSSEAEDMLILFFWGSVVDGFDKNPDDFFSIQKTSLNMFQSINFSSESPSPKKRLMAGNR